MRLRLTAVAALAFVIGSACVGPDRPFSTAQERPDPTISVDLDQSDSPAPHAELADIIEQVLPTVVNVRVTSIPQGSLSEVQGQGSGVIIDEEGVIVTNNHVVECALRVRIVFTDDHEPVTGEVIGSDPEHDLAVIKVDPDDLQAIELGDSSSLRLGDQVAAIGFPLGLGGPTVTSGIISGSERTIEPQGGPPLQGVLQTDAAINPGNSGGALIDMNGRLVGINTAGASAGTAENVGFAIAIDSALPVIEDILDGGDEGRAWLGVIVASVDTATAAAQLGLDPDVRGALIQDIVADRPAEQAGLRAGHLLVEVAGEEITSAADLTRVLADLRPDQRVEVRAIDVRDGSEDEFRVSLGRRNPCPEQ